MNQFANYMPNAWQVEGMTVKSVPTSRERKNSQKLNRSWKVTLVACAFAAGLSYLDMPVQAGGVRVSGPITTATSHITRAPGYMTSDVPPGYFPKLVSILRTAPQISDDGSIDDPEPIV